MRKLIVIWGLILGMVVSGLFAQDKKTLQDKPSDEELLKKEGISTKVEDLGKFILGDEEEIRKLIKDLDDDSWKTRESATNKLIFIDEPAVPFVKMAEKSDNPEVALRAKNILKEILEGFYPKRQKLLIAAVRVLSKSKDKNATKPLLVLLNHRDYDVSIESAKFLYNFRDTDTVKSCIKEFKDSVEKFRKEKKDYKAELSLEKIYHITRDEIIKEELDKLSGDFYTPWPKYRGDLRNTGQSPYLGTQTNKLKWKFKTGNRVDSSPAIGRDDTIYFGSFDGHLYAIAPDGKPRWRFKTNHWIDSSPVVAKDDTIYFASCNGHLYALSPEGKLKWNFKTNGEVHSSPAISRNGTIYFGSDDKHLYALSPDGKLKWKFNAGRLVRFTPAISKDGTIYFGSSDNFLYALSPDGKVKWKFKTERITDLVYCCPAVSKDGTIYFGTGGDGHLYALSPTGKLKWKFRTGENISSSPAIAKDGIIYFASGRHRSAYLYALFPDGKEKWKFKTDGGVCLQSPILSNDGTIYIGSGGDSAPGREYGRFYAIRPNGKLKWKFKTNDSNFSSPAISKDGTIYFGSGDGYLYAIGNK